MERLACINKILETNYKTEEEMVDYLADKSVVSLLKSPRIHYVRLVNSILGFTKG